MTNTSRNVRHAVHLALAACAAGAGMPLAQAQTAPAAATTAPPLEEVVVTGSRLLQTPNEVSISPITSVSAEQISRTGLVRTEDILNALPQVSAEQSSGNSIASNGIATVSLRGLGSQRTEVLINGRRMQPGGAGGVVGPGGNANSPDINQIPAELIERVDVLTGGASAVYGADAVAGVVNFILNTHFDGVKIDGEYSFNNHENNNELYKSYLTESGNPLPPSTVNTGQNRNFSVLVGSNFADGKGNATAYATFLHSNPAVGNQFDHAGCTLNGGATPTGPLTCGGSSTSGHGAFEENGFIATAKGGYVTRLFKNTINQTNGQMQKYANSDAYNYGALSYFQRGADRWTAGAFLHYDINDKVQLYSETMFARNTSSAQYGPSGAFAYQGYLTDCNLNPLLSAPYSDPTVHTQLCNPANLALNQAYYNNSIAPGSNISGSQVYLELGRRNVEGGGRIDNYTSDAIRQVLGVKGGWGDVWTYDAYGSWGITDFADNESNFRGTPQVQNALTVVGNPAVGGIAGVPVGAPVCAAALNGSAPTCVPWNIYRPSGLASTVQGGVTPAALAYMTVPSTYSSNATEYIVDASVTGELGKYGVKLPTANAGLSVNIGTEYRSESFDFNPDYIYSNGLQEGGAPSEAINGGFHVWEGFTEMRLPLLSDMTMAQDLSLEAGYRYSSYSLGFNTNTYKFGLEWTPIHDVRLRGSYNRAVRAPDLNELYTPATVGAGGTADPCWGPVGANGLVSSGYTPAECAKTGVSAGQYGHVEVNTAAQINTKTGGNANLEPEKADTYSAGVVFQPSFLQNFYMSVDYWNIVIQNTISTLPSTVVIQQCATGDGSTCNLIHRGSDGSLWTNTPGDYVSTNFQNIGKVSTKGIDVLSSYRLDLPQGNKLSFNLNGTYTMAFDTQSLNGGPIYNCVGFYGSTCTAPIPAWRHVFGTTWQTPWAGLDMTFRWRFIGPSSVDGTSTNPLLSPNSYYVGADHIPGYNYFDFSAAMPIGNNVDIRVGVNNITDKNPPVVPGGNLSSCPNTTCNDNTWVGTYDTLGRFIYGHITVKF
jgi:iron complex outermembrane recepter protein